MEPVILTLANPITVGDATITELRFHRLPTTGDFRDVSLNDMNLLDMAKVAGRICGYPPSTMALVAGEDIGRLNKVMTDFLLPGPRTGD